MSSLRLVRSVRFSPRVLLPATQTFTLKQRTITHKSFREPTPKRPPFDYVNKEFRLYNLLFDDTLSRLDENSKLIVVEGNIAAGKSQLAKKIAEEFDFLYVPEASMDYLYINDYGIDCRDYRDLFSKETTPFDVKCFYEDPHSSRVSAFQYYMLRTRHTMYMDALAHIMNTGQGVVMDRCVYSDFVFAEAMYKFGYLKKPVRDALNEIRKAVTYNLLRPHLVIYLDIPASVAKDRIEKRGKLYEKKTSVLTDSYLLYMEELYKRQFLKDIEEHAEILIYDWSNYGDPEVVVEDIERVNLDDYDVYDTKMKDWRFQVPDLADGRRRLFTNTTERTQMQAPFRVCYPDATEMFFNPEELQDFWYAYRKVPGNQFSPGFNKEFGDTNIPLKNKLKKSTILIHRPVRDPVPC